MATEVIMPKLGQTMEEGTLIEWFVKEGDQVEQGDPLFKFESDKAALDAESPANGTVLKLLRKAGEVVPILEVVAVIGKPGEDISKYLGGASAAGAAVVEEEAAPAEAPAAPAATAEPAPGPEAPVHAPGERIFASPRARHLAAQEGVDLDRIAGSGREGRIVEKDIQAYVDAQPKATPVARKLAAEAGVDLSQAAAGAGATRVTRADVERVVTPTAPAAPVAPAAPTAPAVAVAAPPLPAQQSVAGTVPVSGVRAIIAERMSASSQQAAAVTLTTEVDATRLVEVREGFKKTPLAGDLVPSYNDILVLMVARALQEQPNMNARLNGNVIERLTQINIGVAVDTERGLLVPVIRDVAGQKLAQVAAEFKQLMTQARDSKSLPDDLTGGTFTITNLGMYDIDAFTPIINLPECAILGVGRIVSKPAVANGQVVVRQMMALSLTFDHRVNDGAPAARFLQRIKQLVEQPYLLLA